LGRITAEVACDPARSFRGTRNAPNSLSREAGKPNAALGPHGVNPVVIHR